MTKNKVARWNIIINACAADSKLILDVAKTPIGFLGEVEEELGACVV